MTQATRQRPLAGQRVWLARPAHQAGDWAARLEAAGAEVETEPLLQIVAPEDEALARRGLAAAEHATIVLATSPNAVRAVPRLRPGFAPTGRLFAVGAGSAKQLRDITGRPVVVPDSADTSEGLLALPGLTDIDGAFVAMLSGQGGRRRLVDELTRRGARVTKLALYRRQMVAIDRRRLVDLVTRNHAAVVTSGGALVHLCEMLRGCDRACLQPGLERLQLVVPSARVVQLTPEDLFQRRPRAAARMTVEAIIDALAEERAAS